MEIKIFEFSVNFFSSLELLLVTTDTCLGQTDTSNGPRHTLIYDGSA